MNSTSNTSLTESCLLVIDMQNASFSPEYPCYDAAGVLERINALTDLSRKKGLSIIYVRHNGSAQNEYIPLTHGWELLPDLVVRETDIMIEKTANDVFYNTDLESGLKAMNINKLIITGSATEFCVDSSIQSALTKNFDIVVAGDAHTTADKPHLSAEKIIRHYNWVWSNLTPTKGKIEIKNSATILKELDK
ncbi:cysteine hydrolase family protein [Dyadobacter frigoris]|uniref:Cysteine hydrolase n=1 Tax=Dyadobacter frigoris TaxID=2576211 RepID=A0A4V6Y1W5_9BACT|nr:cysteine hydrolase family protein [Dyadobacter frigoris]TKT89303.1 cysteine hydrolase [Dyadobacter frigoris]GLU57082.1 isochorismatase [Dyadobacter frigoris]